MKTDIYNDFLRYNRGKRVLKFLRLIYLNSGFRSVLLFRLQSLLYEHKMLFLSYLFHSLNLSLHGIDIQPGCKIGAGLRVEHPVGIVLGSGAKIGSNCTILQGVTVGVKNVADNLNNSKYPTIGNNVILSANSSVLGDIKIGDGCTVGAHSLVIKSFENDKLILGVPAREIKNL